MADLLFEEGASPSLNHSFLTAADLVFHYLDYVGHCFNSVSFAAIFLAAMATSPALARTFYMRLIHVAAGGRICKLWRRLCCRSDDFLGPEKNVDSINNH